MTATIRRRWASLALAAPLVLGGCSAGVDQQASSDGDVSHQLPEGLEDTPNVVGYLVSATDEEVLLRLPDDRERTFRIRPEDAPNLGVEHLASHAGFTDIGFQVFYETEGDTDYAVAAFETAPPP